MRTYTSLLLFTQHLYALHSGDVRLVNQHTALPSQGIASEKTLNQMHCVRYFGPVLSILEETRLLKHLRAYVCICTSEHCILHHA